MVLFQWFCKYVKFQKFILNKQISKKDGREYGVERDPGVSSVQETPYSYFIYGGPDENRVERDPGVSSVQEMPYSYLIYGGPDENRTRI